jgi:hypothetical protein
MNIFELKLEITAMSNKYLIVFYLFFLCFSASLKSQTLYKALVIDAVEGNGLPFVHAATLGDAAKYGAVSDIDGYFDLSVCDSCTMIRLTYVGYEEKIILVSDLKKDSFNIIKLSAGSLNLSEVLILAGENPAYRIIRAAIENRRKNNPENLTRFKYESYNKSILFDSNNAPKASLMMSDSNLLSKNSLNLPFFYMLMESVTQRAFIYPVRDKETILATRVSGFKNPGFAPLATAFQPFSFYSDFIRVLEKEYINPISPGSIKRYEYRLEDTLFNQRGDTTFVISFFPRKGKNFDALKGQLYISTNGFAVEYVMAEPAEKTLLDLKFEQKYEFIDNKHWFPVQLNFELSMNPYNEGAFTLQGKSYLKNIEIEPKDLRKKDFGLLSVEMMPDAENKDEDFWGRYRIKNLNKKEENTYKTIDSIGQKLNVDGILKISQDLPRGFLPIGKLALDLTKIIDYNPFEKLRLGLGIYTSSLFSKRIVLGGYFGYGFGDKEWKYGADLLWHISPKKDIFLQLEYKNDVFEPAPVFEQGSYPNQRLSPSQSFARRYLLPRLDYREKIEAAIHFRLFRYIQLRPFVLHQEITPGYDYSYSSDLSDFSETFKDFQSGVQLRWTYKEKYAEFNGQRSLTESRYPVLYITYSKGFALDGLGEFDYQKILVGLELKKSFRGFGKTELTMMLGWTDNALPYPMLFNGRGSRQRGLGIYNKNSFQAMGVNEFISDRFAYAFLVHNFGRLRLKNEMFRPEFKVCQSVGFGTLRNVNEHFNVAIKSMEKGYFESGLLVDNLISFKIANMAYYGFGLGVFYRYGPYASVNTKENFAFNINLSLTF